MAMIIKKVHLPKSQVEWIEEESRKTGFPMAHFVRIAMDEFIKRETAKVKRQRN
ncbi:MAG: hypothetical protein UY18_C0050G0005 [Microgenomates group bacterium GW2011_GWF2_47_9]|nr:MAG: hypothetical protein UY18_C0050G0005 [Microgenomates group bacterium GW2011_GWF2_47_9]